MENAEFVLVLNKEKKIRCMVTHFDLAMLYLNLVKPYSDIEVIEGVLRKKLSVLTVDELREGAFIKERREKINSAEDLEFAEYRTLLSRFWEKLRFGMEKDYLLKELEYVNQIRNTVMHFRPGGVSGEDAQHLESVKRLLVKK